MSKIFRLLCLVAVTGLCGCGIADQPFSCVPTVSSQRTDTDLYIRPATRDASGYFHC